jgi:hypothetical protein
LRELFSLAGMRTESSSTSSLRKAAKAAALLASHEGADAPLTTGEQEQPLGATLVMTKPCEAAFGRRAVEVTSHDGVGEASPPSVGFLEAPSVLTEPKVVDRILRRPQQTDRAPPGPPSTPLSPVLASSQDVNLYASVYLPLDLTRYPPRPSQSRGPPSHPGKPTRFRSVPARFPSQFGTVARRRIQSAIR